MTNFCCIGCTFLCCFFSCARKYFKPNVLILLSSEFSVIIMHTYMHVDFVNSSITSFHLTLLKTLERCPVIVYPLRSRTWFSPTKSKVQVIFIIIYVTLLFLPRYTSLYVRENVFKTSNNYFYQQLCTNLAKKIVGII